MPRVKRELGETGWAHIILRGINREYLFYDDEDFERFRTTVERFRRESGFPIAIMCMMSNHVHILLQEESGAYSQIMKKIAVSYASYYNKKYDRVGHVFQDRFRSEPVNDEKYYLTVLRYIYQNPAKAGVSTAEKYPHTILNKDKVLSGFFDSDEALFAFLNEENGDRCLDYDTTTRLTDEQAIALIKERTGCANPQMMQSVEKNLRDSLLCDLKHQGLTVRQLSGLTGINRNIVQRA